MLSGKESPCVAGVPAKKTPLPEPPIAAGCFLPTSHSDTWLLRYFTASGNDECFQDEILHREVYRLEEHALPIFTQELPLRINNL